MKLENAELISEIIMHPTATCKCAIGQDWYVNEFTVVFVPGETYPDYMDVDKWVEENLQGKELNIEQAVYLLFVYLQGYKPLSLTVTSRVENVKTHFPVEVTKTSEGIA